MLEEKRYFTRSRLVAFLYELLRDETAPNTVEKIIRKDEEAVKAGASKWEFEDMELFEKANDFAGRLSKDVDEGRTIRK